MPHDIGCWKCGASLAALSLPFGRSDRCRQCGADLHVCKACGLFDPRAAADAARAELDKLFGK